MVSLEFESGLIYLNHCAMDVSYHLKMAESYGCLSNTNASPTFATGVVASHTRIKTVIYGLIAKELCHWRLNNMVHGYVHSPSHELERM